MAIIFYHDEEQEQLALETKKIIQQENQGKVLTQVVPATEFYPAEDYHQKYYLQKVPQLMEEYNLIYPLFQDFVASTAVARVNGYVGGYGTNDLLRKELDMLGLSAGGKKALTKIAAGFKRYQAVKKWFSFSRG